MAKFKLSNTENQSIEDEWLLELRKIDLTNYLGNKWSNVDITGEVFRDKCEVRIDFKELPFIRNYEDLLNLYGSPLDYATEIAELSEMLPNQYKSLEVSSYYIDKLVERNVFHLEEN